MSFEDRTLIIVRQDNSLTDRVAALRTLWNQSNEISLYLTSKIVFITGRRRIIMTILLVFGIGRHITDDDAIVIAEALKHDQQLQRLYLGDDN
jgi:hypothetical protein